MEAHAGIGYIARRKGDWAQAVADIDQALRLSPRDGELHSEQAANYVYLRRYADAERELTQALALEPKLAATTSHQASK